MSEEIFKILQPFAFSEISKAKEMKQDFVYYTSADTAIKIIDNQEIWLRHAGIMNDYREIDYGRSLLWSFLSDEKNKKTFEDTLNSISTEITKKILEWLKIVIFPLKFNVYISCLSKHNKTSEDNHGRLSMWRDYGNTAIIINHDIIFAENNEGKKIFMVPVNYIDQEEFNRYFISILSNINQQIEFLKKQENLYNSIIFMLNTLVISLKHKGFIEEQEWRMVYFPEIYKSESENVIKSIVTLHNIPQIIYKIKLCEFNINCISQLIRKVIIGPSEYPYIICQAFTEKFSQKNIDVECSDIPLRV